jgi:lysophospholipase L1-like esterase
VQQQGSEDWRKATIIGDHVREPDPVLFWRSRPVWPYNAQRFQGPIAEVPKPADVFRIICYGDSNTDGLDGDGGWPLQLGNLLAAPDWMLGKTVEVLNAGVRGYSSHQGLKRFAEEVALYEPDLIFVSFGWNDAPEALGKKDKDFEIPTTDFNLYLQRTLLRFRTYRILRSLKRDLNTENLQEVGPRVPVGDYTANLAAFHDLATQHQVQVILLTRPHQKPASELAQTLGWRSTVPDYNRALLSFAEQQGVPTVDVQAHFQARTDLFVDECHFSDDGHVVMAQRLRDELTTLFGK